MARGLDGVVAAETILFELRDHAVDAARDRDDRVDELGQLVHRVRDRVFEVLHQAR